MRKSSVIHQDLGLGILFEVPKESKSSSILKGLIFKAYELMELLAFKEDIHLGQVIAVGDGANDFAMLEKAGMCIAFHAKPTVKASAQHAISVNGLDTILYLFGFRDREINV